LGQFKQRLLSVLRQPADKIQITLSKLTLSVLEQLRDASKSLWGASSEAYFRVDELFRQLANPKPP
jgi:hypothetical protein